MGTQYQHWIALVRAIGPLTHKKMPMSQLRAGCVEAGLKEVRTVLATGNVIFASELSESEIFRRLSKVVATFDLQNDVFLRRAQELKEVLAENPFPEASTERPNHMLVLFMSKQPTKSEIMAAHSFGGPERVRVIGKEAYIDYINGVARSKLTPGRLERLLGRSGTARNWNTIGKLVDQACPELDS